MVAGSGRGTPLSGVSAVEDLSMKNEQSSLVDIVCPKSAGKPTVFNMLTGVYRPTDGGIRLDGQNLVGKKPHEICRLGVARTFQNIRLFTAQSVLDNVKAALHNRITYSLAESMLHLGSYRRTEKEMDGEAMRILRLFDLESSANDRASNLPYGKQRKLEIARALASDPRLLILDEPAGGMNDQETVALVDTIAAIRDRGITVLLIEHDMRLVMQICEHLVVLENGTLIAQGTPDHVRNHPAVIEAYLGSDDSETW